MLNDWLTWERSERGSMCRRRMMSDVGKYTRVDLTLTWEYNSSWSGNITSSDELLYIGVYF